MRPRLGGVFWLLFCGESASAVGTGASAIALPLVSFQDSGDVRAAGLVSTALSVGIVAARLPAGLLADRHERRTILLWCNAVGALVLGALAVLQAAHAAQLAVLLVAAFLLGTVGSTLAPAENVAVRNVVDAALLPRALALLQGRSAFAMIAGPLAGGALLKADAAWVFGADALTYLTAACCAFLLPSRTGPVSAEKTPLRATAEGLRFLWRSPLLRYGALNATVLNLVFNGLLIVIIASSQREGTGEVSVGVQTAALGAGALVGALAAAPVARHLPVRHAIVGATAVIAAALTGFAVAQDTWGSALMLALAAAAGPVISVVVSAAQMRITPLSLQGRVHSGSGFLAQAIAPLGPVLAGASSHAFGLTPTVFGAAGLVLLLAAVGAFITTHHARDPDNLPHPEAPRLEAHRG
ncbi:MFS transporter [Streptomyces flavofungini]|uniref:Multidrug efflux pump Tap n=1 Tax=Streptomyces flavofungini TaxID=68200 RepID=A0ABS0XIG3_9ACTN|nr:MFS transporter [Streptomyces flavofungini]MBJ3813011.1 MFS transporter [Streptomyces flavofungini]GHC43117.1 MFS transporter [Streptomyces flavofungini]